MKRIGSLFICFTAYLLCSCSNDDTSADKSTEKKQPDSPAIVKEILPAQGATITQVDISPMDMIYFPVDYPKQKMAHTTDIPPAIRVIYSRPHRQGRKIFGDHLKYGEYWRLGANEATEIQLYRDINIQGKKVDRGRYVLYCIPYENKWTIVFSSNIDSWGLTKDPKDDLFRFDIPVKYTEGAPAEYFTMIFENTTTGCDLLMTWENITGRLSFTL